MKEARQARHYPILDALRFVLAFWVVMSHFGVFPLFAGAETSNWFARNISHFWSTLTYGIPAVIGFFVISGFCIHLPFRHGESLVLGQYYARRYIRILVPVTVALVLSRLAGNHQPIFGQKTVLWSSVLWSLVCEEIYYAVYPMIRPIRNRFGWKLLLGGTFVLAIVTLAMKPRAEAWFDFGAWRTALILFPVWLLGCILAEQSDQLAPINSASVIWKWRFLAWAGSWICEMLNFKGGIPYTQSMLCFGLLAFFWIKNEIAYSHHKQPSSLLIFGGAWSYSLYLMHYPAMAIFEKLHVPNLGDTLNWCVSIAFILGVSYAFYRFVEKPSHKLARRFKALAPRESKSKDPEALTGEVSPGTRVSVATPS